MPCPICNRPAQPRPQNTAAPFCSARCKQVDLGNWLSDNYRVASSDDVDENGASLAGGDATLDPGDRA